MATAEAIWMALRTGFAAVVPVILFDRIAGLDNANAIVACTFLLADFWHD